MFSVDSNGAYKDKLHTLPPYWRFGVKFISDEKLGVIFAGGSNDSEFTQLNNYWYVVDKNGINYSLPQMNIPKANCSLFITKGMSVKAESFGNYQKRLLFIVGGDTYEDNHNPPEVIEKAENFLHDLRSSSKSASSLEKVIEKELENGQKSFVTQECEYISEDVIEEYMNNNFFRETESESDSRFRTKELDFVENKA